MTPSSAAQPTGSVDSRGFLDFRRPARCTDSLAIGHLGGLPDALGVGQSPTVALERELIAGPLQVLAAHMVECPVGTPLDEREVGLDRVGGCARPAQLPAPSWSRALAS